MKKSFKITVLCLMTAAAALAGTALAYGGVEAEEPAAVYAPPETAAETAFGERVYVLREENGFIAVYLDGKCVTVTEIPAGLLRSADRQALREGIEVKSREDLMKLIEDFSS